MNTAGLLPPVTGPLWDLNTFTGRVKHFAWMTDPRTVLISSKELLEAKDIVVKAQTLKEIPPGVTAPEFRRARQLHESAFHPDTGELQTVIGRMSFQVPGGMILTGALMAFYRTVPQVVFWQWVNQSFNAIVNYTNRNAKSDISIQQLGVAYVSATTCAVGVSLGLKRYLSRFKNPLVQRFVPLGAVCSANLVNAPLMRQGELISGIPCVDEKGNAIAKSQYAAIKALSQVVLTRLAIVAPAMILTPVIMENLEKRRLIKRYIRYLNVPLQTALAGVFLLFCVPVALAIFPQTCSIPTSRLKLLDKKEYERIQNEFGDRLPTTLYFNKGL